MNKIMLIGQTAVAPTGKEGYAKFRLAVDEHYKDRQGTKKTRTEFFQCAGFGSIGDNIQNIIKLGDTVYLEGRLQSSSYVDSKHQKRRSWTVVVNVFKIVKNNDRERAKEENTQRSDNHADPFYAHTRE